MFILNKEFWKIPCSINGIIGESKVHKAGAVKENKRAAESFRKTSQKKGMSLFRW